jgi:hypothetical protein
MDTTKMNPLEAKKLLDIMNDPIKWAQVFVRTWDPQQKKVVPWVARWYQIEMLRDQSNRKVYRCGRRTGKTETMVLDMLHKTFTKNNYRCLVVTPYENQVRLIFMRLRELLDHSPHINAEVVKNTSNPYNITFKNNSAILGFTTGASSGSGGASIRGQRADWLFMDEVDYMGDADFDSVTAIAAERSEIGISMSSTPTGRRSQFYKACTDPKMKYTEHYHPSMHNPNWGVEMESELRAQLSEQGYVHEILAEFGTQNTGVFDKDKLDLAMLHECYSYNELDHYQKIRVKDIGIAPNMYLYNNTHRAPMHPFRTMGVDWDKYGASSSIVILDFDVIYRKFKVIKRVEVPRGEYSYDNAINTIVELNEIYNPSWIYCDAGAGEYQIERLHIIGDERPATGLKNKVKRWQFSNTLDIIDPVTKEMHKEPLKPFMVTQLQIAFDRSKMMLSPFDEILHKQLIDYEVVRISASGQPIFSSENEHYIDALGLSYLAFVLEFPQLTNTIKEAETATKIEFSRKQLGGSGLSQLFNEIQSHESSSTSLLKYDPSDLPGDRATMVKVQQNYRSGGDGASSWGARSNGARRGRNAGRSSW